MDRKPLRAIAPPQASNSPPRGKTWLLSLDQIESGTGEITGQVIADAKSAGSSTFAFDNRHVLYSKLRPYLNKVICPNQSGIATTELIPLLPNPAVCDRRYLCHYLRSPKFVEWASRNVSGAKMPRVVITSFWRHEVPLPPLEEQRRIADILDRADAIRRKRQLYQGTLSQLREALFLHHFGPPDPSLSKHTIKKIGDLCRDVRYGTAEKASYSGNLPVIRMNNITYEGGWDFRDLKRMTLAEKDFEKYTVRKGDILFNRTNSKDLVGKTAVYYGDHPMAFAGYLVRSRVNKSATPEYISGFLNSGYGKATLRNMCNNIVGMANINATKMQGINIPVPPIEAQREYSKIIMAAIAHASMIAGASDGDQYLYSSLSHQFFC